MEASNLKIGTILKSPTQEYRIEKILGCGGFGITYLATSKVKYGNVSFNVKFAIKEHFMDTCYRDDDGIQVHCSPSSHNSVELSRKDFLNEAKRLKSLCQYSRNIVNVNEAFEANGTAYYVMEYLDGGSPKRMDETSAVKLISQIAGAVKILHDNKLLHLDIKPDNIILKTAEDGSTDPVLIDFGIAKHFDKKGNPTSSPNAKGMSMGYAPIEQIDSIHEFAPTLDIYALGATLLYLLTGKNPPASVKLLDPSQREIKGLIPSSVSASTRNAIIRAMNPNKNDRTQNVTSFLTDLNIRNCEEEITKNKTATDSDPFIKRSNTEPINNNKFKTERIKDSNSKNSEGRTKGKIYSYVAVITILMVAFGLIFVVSNNDDNNSLKNVTPEENISTSNDIVYERLNVDGHDCVDMGLSVNWATYNLGAGHFGGSPEVLGDFFAFGELTPFEQVSNKQAAMLSGVKTMNKNITWLRDHKIVDSNNNLTSQYDAATHEWGEKWRTPTIDELKELFSKCIREPGKIDGRNGVWLTGPSGATIFLPAQGNRTNKGWDDACGLYMSSTASDKGDIHCEGIIFCEDKYLEAGFYRNNVYLIRPVSNKH